MASRRKAAAKKALRMSGSERREQLLKAARRTFIARGYRAATTLAVAKGAGVSETLVLKHFGSKEQLYRAAIIEPLFQFFRARLRAVNRQIRSGELDSLPGQYETWLDILVQWADVMRSNTPQLLLLLGDLHDFPDAAAQLRRLIKRPIEELIRTIAGKAQPPEFKRFNARVAGYAAFALATAAAMVADRPKQFIDNYLRISLVGVLTPTGKRRLGLK